MTAPAPEPAEAPIQRERAWMPHAHSTGVDQKLLAILFALAALPYLGILRNGFVYDDDTQLLRNPFVRNFSHLKQIFTTSVWSFQGGSQGVTNYYRPVMTLTYAVCHAMFGFNPAGFHLVSILLNAGVCCLLFWTVRRMFRDHAIAFVAAALFALHPVHTEAVDWVAAVTDIEAAFFALLSFLAFLSLESTARKKWGVLMAAMLASFALALLSKESAAVLPLLALIYEHACRPDRSSTSLSGKLSRYGGLWLALAGYIVVRVHMLGSFAPAAPRRSAPLNEVALSAVALAGHYFRKMVWPAKLSAAHVFPSNLASLLPGIITGLATLIVCALLMIWAWKAERRVFFGLAWFFIALTPALNIRWMPDFVFAERYLYLPSAGLCWAAAWLAISGWRKSGAPGKRALAAAACALALVMAARIALRGRDWKNNLTFYSKTLASSPRAAMIRNDLGDYYWDRDDFADAGREWDQAYQVDPGIVYVLDNLGLLRMHQNRDQDAIIFFERALAVNAQDEGAHRGLGQAYDALGMKEKARQELLAAIKLAPLDVRARVSLGELYFDEGKYAEATAQFQAANGSLPTTRADYGLGLAEWMRGDQAAAENAFKAALILDPGGARPHFMLGLFYGATGRAAAAISEYKAGLRIDPANQKARTALAKLRARPAAARRP